MFDRYNRHIHYLRISVTDRCNLRCIYCMPEEGINLMPPGEILSFEEITELVKTAISMGADKIRLTGGEPLVRKNITDLVHRISVLPGIRDLALTTNGILLEEMAMDLKKAGLQRINVSLDTLDPVYFKELTRGGDLHKVLAGIEAARKAGLEPVKINCVVNGSRDNEHVRMVKAYGAEKGLQVRFIRQMNLKTGDFSVVEGGEGGNCSMCNRLRLTANGMVKPCLFSDMEFPVRKLGAQAALEKALEAKPLKGCYNMTGQFYNIGG
jgi:GTP 3',8-cyclase